MLPKDLSGGEEAESGDLARALVTDPPIILADEPTASLETPASPASRSLHAGLLRDLANNDSRLVVVASAAMMNVGAIIATALCRCVMGVLVRSKLHEPLTSL